MHTELRQGRLNRGSPGSGASLVGHLPAEFQARVRNRNRVGPMQSVRNRAAVAILVMGILLNACTRDRSSAPTSTASPSSETGVAIGLDGTYEITVKEGDTSSKGGAQPGRWTLTLDSGAANLKGPENFGVELDPLELNEKRLIVPPDFACPNNDPEPGRGIYQVQLSADTLSFKEVVDPCRDRAFTLTQYVWHRVDPE